MSFFISGLRRCFLCCYPVCLSVSKRMFEYALERSHIHTRDSEELKFDSFCFG